MPLLRMKFERVGRAAAPTLNNDSAYRPSSGRFCGHLPQGKANLRGGGRLLHRLTVHPLRHLRCHLPTRREANALPKDF